MSESYFISLDGLSYGLSNSRLAAIVMRIWRVDYIVVADTNFGVQISKESNLVENEKILEGQLIS